MLEPTTLSFPNGNTASVVEIDPAIDLTATLHHIGLQDHRPALVVIGGASKMTSESLRQLRLLFQDVFAPVAESVKAYVLDGGTNAGVMQMMGQARGDRKATFPLVGVAPFKKVTLDTRPSETSIGKSLEPNHTHFLLTPGESWGDESPWLAQVATVLAGNFPSVAVLVNGGEASVVDVEKNSAVGRPVVVLSGSGRLADEIATGIQTPNPSIRPEVARLIQANRLIVFDMTRPEGELTDLLKQLLGQPSLPPKSPSREYPAPPNITLLSHAWARQQAYSQNASGSQNRFKRLRHFILVLSLLATLLSVIYGQIENQALRVHNLTAAQNPTVVQSPNTSQPSATQSAPAIDKNPFLQGIKILLLLTPIASSVLLAGAIKFDRGTNWILLRGSAEALKREIFFYRTRFGPYGQNRDRELAQRIKTISERLKGSPVHQACLQPHEMECEAKLRPLAAGSASPPSSDKDDRFSDLTPERYLQWRLTDQFTHYRQKTRKLNEELQRFQWLIYIVGGVGTLLVAVQLEAWVAVSGALIAVLTSYLEMQRIEATLVGYNQAADGLYDTRAWWNSLTEKERKNPENFDLLVKTTEGILQSEHDSWLQDMQDRLAELYGADQSGDNAHPQGKELPASHTDSAKPQ